MITSLSVNLTVMSVFLVCVALVDVKVSSTELFTLYYISLASCFHSYTFSKLPSYFKIFCFSVGVQVHMLVCVCVFWH